MCARFTLKSSSDVVGGLFDLEDLPDLRPRYNIAPTQDILAVISLGGARAAAWFRWGLIPSWAKNPDIGQKMINARSETASEKPSFRSAFRKHRCLIVADGFYEWTDPDPRDFDSPLSMGASRAVEGSCREAAEHSPSLSLPLESEGEGTLSSPLPSQREGRGRGWGASEDPTPKQESLFEPSPQFAPLSGPLPGGEGTHKAKVKLPRQPWWIGMKSHGPFAFAGLWELNQQTELRSVETCCILTTTPNELLEPMHDRMPVILPREYWDLWLDPDFSNVEALEALMRPYSAVEMETYKVDPELNNPRREGKDYSVPWRAAGSR